MLEIYYNNSMRKIIQLCLEEEKLPKFEKNLKKFLEDGLITFKDVVVFKDLIYPKDKIKFISNNYPTHPNDPDYGNCFYERHHNAWDIYDYLPRYENYIVDYDNVDLHNPSTNFKKALKSKLDAIQQSIIAFCETVRLISNTLKDTYRISIHFSIEKRNGQDSIEDPRVTFYKMRKNQVVHHGNLNRFKIEAILRADIDEKGSPLLQKSNEAILKHFLDLPNRNILPKWYSHLDK